MKTVYTFYSEAFRIALQAILSHKLRAFLTLIGIMIARMANVGPVSEEEWELRNRRNKRLTWDDFEWVLANCTLCQEVGAEVSRGVDVRQNGEQLFGTDIQGVT